MSWLPINNKLAALRQTADLIREQDEFTTYLGFCKPGTVDKAQANWSIMKIVQTGTSYPKETQFLWADGKCSFNLIWHNREDYDYTFQKFRV